MSIWILAVALPTIVAVGGGGVWLGRRSAAERAATQRVARFAAWRADWRARFRAAVPDLSDGYNDPDTGRSR